MKVKSSKGFTLAELLIVMAIIVVLAAVAIPTFGRQLETARETGDMENIRNAYTEAMSIAILDCADGKLDGKKGTVDVTGPVKITPGSGDTENKEVIYRMQIAALEQNGAWQYVNNTISGHSVDSATAIKSYQYANFKFILTNGNLSLSDMTPGVAANPEADPPVSGSDAIGITFANSTT